MITNTAVIQTQRVKLIGYLQPKEKDTSTINAKYTQQHSETHTLGQTVGAYLYSVRVIVQQQHSRAGHLLGLYHGLQIGQQAHVLGHISGQHLDWSK